MQKSGPTCFQQNQRTYDVSRYKANTPPTYVQTIFT